MYVMVLPRYVTNVIVVPTSDAIDGCFPMHLGHVGEDLVLKRHRSEDEMFLRRS